MQTETNRFLEMPKVFDKMAPYLVPQYYFLQSTIYDIINFQNNKVFSFIDLGAGSGIQIEKILSKFPKSKAVYVDSSTPFTEIAKKRLECFSDRVQYINNSLESDWHSEIYEKPELIISMSAIHHLEHKDKERLYKTINEILLPNGWFINIDEMKSRNEIAYKNSMLFWAKYVENAKNVIPSELNEYYDEWKKHFNGWKKRNIDNMNSPKVKGDDIHESFEIQLGYLEKAGFRNIDLFVKFHLWCVIGGQKLNA